MGFKRTTEGRVFFQNLTENGAVAAATAGASNPITHTASPPPLKKPEGGAVQQAQIIALLKSLNQRLQGTQADRDKLQQELETYKAMVMALQDKTKKQEVESESIRKQLSERGNVSGKRIEEAEKLSKETFQEFEEARRLIAEIEERAERTESLVKKQQAQNLQSEERNRIKWEKLEQNQQRQAKEILLRINKNEDSQKMLGERVEESITVATRLERKIEKAVQDRSRLLRKLERIEETVLQTNEALNARAMVLLTDQNAAMGSGYPATQAALGQDNANHYMPQAEQYQDIPWWQKPMRMQATSVSMIVLGAALLGWFVSTVQKPDAFNMSFEMPEFSMPSFGTASNNIDEPMSYDRGTYESASITQDTDYSSETALSPEAVSAFDSMIEGHQQQAQEPIQTSMQNEMVPNDIGAIDLNNEEQLLAALEGNPDALAAQLNEIEPQSAPATEEVTSVEDVAAYEAPVSLAEPVVSSRPSSEFSQNLMAELSRVELPSKLDGPITARIKADSSLPVKIMEIERSAFEGNPETQHDLAAIYVAGHAGVRQDYQRAAQWFDEAAHNGVANARYNLGVLYHQGIGVKQDVEKAFIWYKTAAALGHPEAQYNLGIAYIEGIGVSYDPQRAAVFFENAANQGVMEAAYNLGLIYENGLLGKAQPDTALMWYKRAADKGSPEAKAALEQLAKSLGMNISDVNRLIEGMEVLQTSENKKKLN